ncbi:MAG TPA: DUF3606 domain-containing protein [Mucilaginibacter sp.]
MDNYNSIGSPGRDRININENYEVEYWANKFGVKPDQLRSAVEAVGTASADVEKYLNK